MSAPAAGESDDIKALAKGGRTNIAGFFVRLIAEAHVPAESILYVGDRLDNDVLPARAAGMRTVFLRRGPWGRIHALTGEAALADHVGERVDEEGRVPGEHGAEEEADEQAGPAEREPHGAKASGH